MVSILIPAYNAETWIAQTLRSALGQTWERREIIVVDDGSADATLTVARQFESAGVRVVAQPNQGAAAARNTAYAASKGDYIQWLDADDLLARDKIALQVQALEQADPRTLVSCSWGRFLHRPYRAEFTPDQLWRDLSPAAWLTVKLGQNVYMPVHSWLASREITDAAGPWDVQQSVDDDGEYLCRLLQHASQVRFVPGAKVYYRQSGSGSLSHLGRSEKKMHAQWRSTLAHIECLRGLEDSEPVRRACVEYLRMSLTFFHPESPELVGRAMQLAKQLGGELELPELSKKYAWVAAAFGERAGKYAQRTLIHAKWSAKRAWDHVLLELDRRGWTGDVGPREWEWVGR